jgi:hypothetical protein
MLLGMSGFAGSPRAVRAGVACLVTLALMASAGCQVRAHRTKAYVRRAAGISIVRPVLPQGEALIEVHNDSTEPARLVLARVPSANTRLPVDANGVVPMGTAADLEYQGSDYRVVLKSDDIAPYFAHGRTSTTLHLFLRRGFYVLFSNRPGDYAAGRQTVLRVT